MIDLYYAPTPNTWNVSIMLEECALPYRVIPIDIMSGAQKKPGFLAINPNGRIPTIVDSEGEEGGQAVARWFFALSARPAVQRGRTLGIDGVSEEHRARLTGPYYGAP